MNTHITDLESWSNSLWSTGQENDIFISHESIVGEEFMNEPLDARWVDEQEMLGGI